MHSEDELDTLNIIDSLLEDIEDFASTLQHSSGGIRGFIDSVKIKAELTKLGVQISRIETQITRKKADIQSITRQGVRNISAQDARRVATLTRELASLEAERLRLIRDRNNLNNQLNQQQRNSNNRSTTHTTTTTTRPR